MSSLWVLSVSWVVAARDMTALTAASCTQVRRRYNPYQLIIRAAQHRLFRRSFCLVLSPRMPGGVQTSVHGSPKFAVSIIVCGCPFD